MIEKFTICNFYCELDDIVSDLKAKGEKVINFKLDRVFQISREELDAYIIACKLADEIDMIERVSKKYDIGLHEWDLEKIIKNGKIKDGYMNVVNFIFSALMNRDAYIIIEDVDQSLHPKLVKPLVKDLINLSKGLIVTVRSFDTKGSLRVMEAYEL